MGALLVRWLINALALWLTVLVVPGLTFTTGDVVQVLLVAAVFGLVNAVLRPIITVLSCPLVVLTLGLFILVIMAIVGAVALGSAIEEADTYIDCVDAIEADFGTEQYDAELEKCDNGGN